MNDTELDAIRRAVVQRLEDFQRGGLTHWKRIVPETPDPSVAPGSSSSQVNSAARVPAVAAAPAPTRPNPSSVITPSQAPSMPAKRHSTPAASPVAATSATYVAFEPLNLSPAQRIEHLSQLAERVKACIRCQELASTRTQTVFGVGDPNAKILFVGEAPGADEDKQGEPFVGRAGQLLNDIIKACRLKREDIYICNVLRCRPPGNRLPSIEEASNCREYLDGQIAVVNPDYIVCWGSTAAKNLLVSEAPIGKMRGKFFQYGRAKVVCTYHPSYLLRNPAAKKDVWDDMKFLFLDMGIDLTAKQ
jgi:DNA polymerase